MWILERLTQSGNTFIEVFVALSIIGIILAGAYSTAARSLRITRQSEERTQSVQFAENQLEVIKAIASSTDRSLEGEKIWDTSRSFCINSNSATPGLVEQFGSVVTLPPLESADLRTSDDGGDYPSGCVFNDLFYAHASHDGSDRFTVTVRWDKLGGGFDEVRYVYGLTNTN